MVKLIKILPLLCALLFASTAFAFTDANPAFDELKTPSSSNIMMHFLDGGGTRPNHAFLVNGAHGEGVVFGVHSSDVVNEDYTHLSLATWSRNGDFCGYTYFLSNYDHGTDAGDIEFAVTCGPRNLGQHINYGQISGSATGQPIILSTQGTDANVGISLQPKGSGHVFATNMYVGVNTNPATSSAVIFVPTGTGNGINFKLGSNTGTSYVTANYNASGTYVGGITATSTATGYVTSSDYRLKTDVHPLNDGLQRVMELKPSTFTWKNTGASGEGFIAHEVQKIVPLAVVGEKDAVDKNGKPVYQAIDNSKLVPILTAAIQELKAANDNLSGRLEKLENARR